MEITILGTGCSKCVDLATLTGWLAQAQTYAKGQAVA